MEQPLMEKLKFWLCDTFGHLGLDGKQWTHGGSVHEDCKFCGRVKSLKSAGVLNNTNNKSKE